MKSGLSRTFRFDDEAGDAQVQEDEEPAEVRLYARQRPRHFNFERHLVDRETYKTRRSAGLAE